MGPYNWANGSSIHVFSPCEYGFTYRKLMLFWEMGMEFKDKIVLYCFKKVKYKQSFITGV